MAAVATGSPFVEIIFRVPGMGRYFVESVLARDYPVIMAVFLFYGVFLQAMNLVVDMLYGVVDPRIAWGRVDVDEHGDVPAKTLSILPRCHGGVCGRLDLR